MKKVIYLPVIIFFIFLSSCKNELRQKIDSKQEYIRKEIPLTKNGKPFYFYKLAKYQASKLKLDSLEVGYDSLQIRIWCEYGLLNAQNVVVIKGSNGKWSAELLTLYFDANDSSYMQIPILKERINKVPASGWSSFIKGLTELNITRLPDQGKVTDYKDILGADGVSYIVEVATKEEYRIYSYWEPDAYKKEYKEAMSMESALEFLEKEFSFKRLKR